MAAAAALAFLPHPAAPQAVTQSTSTVTRSAPAVPQAGGAAGTVQAATSDRFAPLFEPDPLILAASAGSGPLPLGELTALALRASGFSTADLPTAQARLDALLSDLRHYLAVHPAQGEAARAEATLAYLHGSVFRVYDARATTIADILANGRYNCVSSAVLYLIAMRMFGIEAWGAKTTDHAFCVVRAGGREIDVETTNAYGFDPGTKREFSDRFGRTTGYSYVPPGNYALRRAIGERELVGLILSNRLAFAAEANRYEEALSLGADYAILAAAGDGRKVLIDCVDNLAAWMARGGDNAGIEELARTALARLGPDPRLSSLLGTAVHNRLVVMAGGTDWMAAVAATKAAFAEGLIDRRSHDSLLAYAYGNAANALGNKGDWLGAAALADEGARQTPTDPSLARAAAAFRQNFVAVTHNRFALLFNKGDYAAAASAIEEGLRLMPGNPSLLSDLETARKALAARK